MGVTINPHGAFAPGFPSGCCAMYAEAYNLISSSSVTAPRIIGIAVIGIAVIGITVVGIAVIWPLSLSVNPRSSHRPLAHALIHLAALLLRCLAHGLVFHHQLTLAAAR